MDEHDPFEVLGLPARYAIDRAVLHRAYLAKAAAMHPDLSGGGEETEDRTAELNAARAALEDPERRAAVLLDRMVKRHGVAIAPGDARALPDGFLMEMMDTREQMEDAVKAGDRVQIERWRGWAEERRSAHERRVGELFREVEALDESPASAARAAVEARAIRLELNAWRYIERMLEQVGSEGGVV